MKPRNENGGKALMNDLTIANRGKQFGYHFHARGRDSVGGRRGTNSPNSHCCARHWDDGGSRGELKDLIQVSIFRIRSSIMLYRNGVEGKQGEVKGRIHLGFAGYGDW